MVQKLNSHELNLKSRRSTFVVKAYVLFIGIRSSDGEIKSADHLALFDKNRLMPAPGYATITHTTFISHTLHDNNTHTYSSFSSYPTYKYTFSCKMARRIVEK